MEGRYLRVFTVRWGQSRGQDSYGYPLVVARDENGRKVAETCGGGYSHSGVILAGILESQYAERLQELRGRIPAADLLLESWAARCLRGAAWEDKSGGIRLQGAVGYDSIATVARVYLGLEIAQADPDRKTRILTVLDLRRVEVKDEATS